ncbi:Serpentine Receptor, class H [Caenorhabditis elegans]|uniref:Serpentine Receptor, class H n=1 Tax=Caenorhabditis elegans TaxID=6239 RepID=O16306_CAEEL|nr:Serpentine Receptor, class H [Caenorhabditis elegans]CCD69970.2 Serpentine Receptor, class H [Caenorhabditis elegans]|eukprot:NP_503387.2 Uncharacterized protein CELE_T21H3.5 [Caenorhabditis elegans]
MYQTPPTLTAATVIQILTWGCAIPSLIVNVLLIVSINRERRTDNRFRWFNPIFLYMLYCNMALAVLFPLVHPTYFPARGLIYMVFVGPLARILNQIVQKIVYGLIVGIITFQMCIAPITLVLRWMIVKKRISCMTLHYKTIRKLFFAISLFLPITLEIYLIFFTPNQKIESYSEVSHRDVVMKLSGHDFSYFVVDWSFSLLVFTFTIPYITCFIVSLVFHKFYMKSIRNVSNEFIDMGYHDSANINRTLLSIALQNLISISIPHFVLTITSLLKWDLGVRALPASFGCITITLTTSLTIFVNFRAYRRQLGFIIIDFFRQKNVNLSVFVVDNQQQADQLQMSTVGAPISMM